MTPVDPHRFACRLSSSRLYALSHSGQIHAGASPFVSAWNAAVCGSYLDPASLLNRDDFADRVGYHAPGSPEDWREREYHADLQSWGAVSAINAELTEFGQIVSEVLEAEYVDWEAEYEPPEDLPDF